MFGASGSSSPKTSSRLFAVSLLRSGTVCEGASSRGSVVVSHAVTKIIQTSIPRRIFCFIFSSSSAGWIKEIHEI